MIGGDFIAPGVAGRRSRAGRSGLNALGVYVDLLYAIRTAQRPRPIARPAAGSGQIWRP